MPVISGGKLTYVEAKRNKDGLCGNYSVNVKINNAKKGKSGFSIGYSYTADYSDNMGHLKIEGEADVMGDGWEKLYEEWEKEKKFNTKFSEVFLSYVAFIVAANGTLVVRPLNLTPPIPQVRLEIGEEEKK